VISGAGNGWGKSEMLAAIFAAIMWPTLAPPALAHPFITDWQYPKRARIYSTPAELEEIGSLQTAIKKLFPQDRYEVGRGRYSYPSVFHTDSGWTLDLFSYERDASEAAGPSIGLQAFNEPMPEELFKEAVARSRVGGIILGGMTSLRDNPWIVDGLLNKQDKSIRVRYGNSCENCKQHGTNGNLEHEKIEQILSQFDADEREARFSGKPLSLSGRIFKAFDRNVHVAKSALDKNPSDVTHFMAVDPAIGKPIAAIWGYVDRSGVLSIYDEYPDFEFQNAKDSNLSVSDYVNIFRRKEQAKVENRIIDRHFANKRQELGGTTLKQEFADKGLHFFDSYSVAADSPEVETGILKVKDYLRWNKAKPLDALNRPKLIISPNCRNLISSMEKWSRNPVTGKPLENYKDHADCLRYLIGASPEHEVRQNWDDKVRMPYYGVGQIVS
jgi:hypothetical protein